MKLTKDTNILIIGLGVIGGSYATALSKKGYTVRCITKREEDIAYGLSRRMIKQGTTEVVPELVRSAQIIIFALYPTTFINWIREYGSLISEGTLITDVTGVKSKVVDTVQSMLKPGVEFIAAHPMAGRERSGVEYSDPSVFEGANYIVTPTQKNTPEAIDLCCELGRELGFARISTLTTDEHDKMIAHLSQLTHCIAVSLMNCNNSEGLEKYTGDSFRDLTRIAKINDKMWAELFLMNKSSLLSEMDVFMDEFKKFRDMIANEDVTGMRNKMISSTNRRALFDKK